MKSRTWLFIIVLVVFVINVSFFVLVRMAKVDKIVQDRISAQLSEVLNAEIDMDEFSFNDKQANVSGLKISSAGSFDLEVDQIYVEYNLIQLLFSNFKNLKAIKHIKIYEPEFSILIEPKETSGESGEFKIPDLTKFFKMLDIYDGSISLEYNSETIRFANNWRDIDLKIENTKSSEIVLSAISQDSSEMNVSCILEKGKILNTDLIIKDLQPSRLEVQPLDELNIKLNANVNLNSENLNYSLNISEIQTSFTDLHASIDSVTISGNDEKANIMLHNALADGNRIIGEAAINNILRKDRSIFSIVKINKIPISKYIKSVSGELNSTFKISGKISEPLIKAVVTTDEVSVAEQKITDIRALAELKNDHVKLKLDSSYWEDNLITGEGYYNIGNDLNFDIISKKLLWNIGDIEVGAELAANIRYEDELKANADITDIHLRSNLLKIEDLTLKAILTGNDLTADLSNSSNDIGLSCIGNLEDKELLTKLKLNSLDLSKVINGSALPILNGNLAVSANEYSVVLNSNIIVYDKDYGKLGGRIKTDVVLDLSNNRSLVNLRTFKARYNYEPFSIDLLAKGTLDSLAIQHFHINKMITIDGWLRRKPALVYDMNVAGNNLKIKQLAKYLVDFDTSQQLDGEVDLDLRVANADAGAIEGELKIKDFEFGEIDRINAGLSISGDNSMISIKKGIVRKNDNPLIELQGALISKPDLVITATGSIDSINIAELLPESNLKGHLHGGVEYSMINAKNEFQIDLAVDDLKFNRFKADRVNFDILQKDSLLHVNEISCNKKNEFDLSASGAIGYNIINSLVFSDSNFVSVIFEGDLLEMLSDQSKAITEGSSRTGFNFKVGTRDDKIFVEQGRFNLKKGYLRIKDQPEDIDKIAIDINIKDNILIIDKFKFRMGEGRCYISNLITDTNDDFILGTMNLGKMLIKTNDGGILFNMPGYIPANNVAKVVIEGRDNEFFEVKGPFEDITMIGDLNISNGGAIFPPNTENLLKLFNKVREKKQGESAPLPLSFDIMVNFGENVKYVTYPVDVTINPGGYLNIVYANEEFTIPDALFIAEEGSVDIFGTEMELDYLQIQLSKFSAGANISGNFYKKTADGSLITLNIYNEVTENDDLGTLRFSLNSDNATDRITDILAKLRYNRAMDEISPDQKKTLLQDEVIQIAGMGLESAVMDPLLSPVENWIRKILNLDYFHLQTDLVQNLFASYASDDKSQYEIADEGNEIANFSSELFLNNLSISMGRYITRDLFLDYETRVEKSQDIALDSEMGVFHEFSLRYQLPYKFRILYKYEILPFTEKNPHEIMLERSFRF